MSPTTDHLDVFYADSTGPDRFNPKEEEPVQLYRQRHDYELWPQTFSARPAAVFRLDPFDHTLMDEPIQWMWFGQIMLEGAGLAYQTLCQAWVWLTGSTRYMCNQQGTDWRRDYILNVRMDLGLPGIFPLGLGGNVYRGIEEEHRGERCLRVNTMTPDMAFPPDLSYKRYPWWIHYGTVTTTRRLADGSYLVNPFSTNYWIGRNAPSPLMASEPVWIGMDLLQKLPLGAPAPCPYNPPRW